MKKIISVFELLIRNTIYKILFVFVALGGVELLMFWNRLKEQLDLQNYSETHGIGGSSLEYIVNNSHQFGWYTLAFVTVTLILGLR